MDDPILYLPELTYHIAATQIGVHEVGTNWGPEVKMYLHAAEVTVPAAWCAALQNWAAERAAEKLGVRSPLEDVTHQAYVQSYVDYGRTHGWIIPTKEAQRGDLLCVWHQSLKRYGHIAIVGGWTDDKKRIKTVEGNSNTDGSREGVEVCEHERTPTRNILILRWVKGAIP